MLLLSATSIHSLKSILSNVTFIRPIYQKQKTNLYETQKDCHQDNLSFACLQFYKHNCLDCFYKQVKYQ